MQPLERRLMHDDTNLSPLPLIEPWRIVLLILIVVAGMVFAHAITPTEAGTTSQPRALLSQT